MLRSGIAHGKPSFGMVNELVAFMEDTHGGCQTETGLPIEALLQLHHFFAGYDAEEWQRESADRHQAYEQAELSNCFWRQSKEGWVIEENKS